MTGAAVVAVGGLVKVRSGVPEKSAKIRAAVAGVDPKEIGASVVGIVPKGAVVDKSAQKLDDADEVVVAVGNGVTVAAGVEPNGNLGG